MGSCAIAESCPESCPITCCNACEGHRACCTVVRKSLMQSKLQEGLPQGQRAQCPGPQIPKRAGLREDNQIQANAA